MKINIKSSQKHLFHTLLIWVLAIGYFQSIDNSFSQTIQEKDYIEFNGVVKGEDTNKSLNFANISVNETNISVVTNSEGKFLLKVPKIDMDNSITISYLGYKNKVIQLSDLDSMDKTIILQVAPIQLSEISLISKNPNALIVELMKNMKKNTHSQGLIMKGFYRESIKKRRTYASLSEAVVEIYKRPYAINSSNSVKLNKLRKSTDYRKIDTLIIKLQGGPHNTLNMDMVKNTDLFFNEDIFEYYRFSFENAINVDNRITYVVAFKPNGYVSIPLFYGKLYIDAQTFGLSKAIYSLNLDDQKRASQYFVRKKPARAEVLPIRADYRVEYKINNEKWLYNYSRIELSFKIDWTKRIFNSIYSITIEQAITDWRINTENENLKTRDRLKVNVILNDEASGFSDPDFWGEFNVIEPEKSIENAIRKINRSLIGN